MRLYHHTFANFLPGIRHKGLHLYRQTYEPMIDKPCVWFIGNKDDRPDWLQGRNCCLIVSVRNPINYQWYRDMHPWEGMGMLPPSEEYRKQFPGWFVSFEAIPPEQIKYPK